MTETAVPPPSQRPTHAPTLNGWQRLWVVIVVLWTLIVGTFSYAEWPRHASFVNGEVFDGEVVIREDDGTEHGFPRGTDPKVAAATLRQTLQEARSTFMVWVTALWLLPAAAVYLAGWSVAWVRRGFQPAR